MHLRKRQEIQEVLRKAKQLIPAAIILFWLVMMGALLYREVVVPALRPRLDVSRVTRPEDAWMGLFFGGRRVGFIHWATSPDTRGDDAGFRLDLLARMTMPLFGQSASLSINGHAWQSGYYGLRDFDFSLRSGENGMRIEGAVANDTLDARVHAGEDSYPLKIPVRHELLLGGGMGLGSMSMPLLKPGQSATIDTFDPTTMGVAPAKIEALEAQTITVGGKPVETVVMATTVGGVTTKAWVTKEQEVVRAETPFGITVQKITADEAVAPLPAEEGADLLGTVSIKPDGLSPTPDARRMRVRFSGVPEDRMPPDTPVQRRDGDVWTIVEPDPAIREQEAEPITGADAEKYLAGDAFITSGHEKIKALAKEVTGDTQDDWDKAVLLLGWVYENIQKTRVLSMPNAVEVLRSRQGDCNEHAVLFTALARAAGIPARVAVGLAWSEEMKAFGYHAWAEVFAQRWLPMDPTFGERVADATHIKLLDGSIEDWPRLLGYVGSLRIEVLEAE